MISCLPTIHAELSDEKEKRYKEKERAEKSGPNCNPRPQEGSLCSGQESAPTISTSGSFLKPQLQKERMTRGLGFFLILVLHELGYALAYKLCGRACSIQIEESGFAYTCHDPTHKLHEADESFVAVLGGSVYLAYIRSLSIPSITRRFLQEYGFIGKYQAPLLDEETVDEACWKVVKQLASRSSIASDVRDGAIQMFGESNSFNASAANARKLKVLEPFSNRQLE
jgi:hypothetical protein